MAPPAHADQDPERFGIGQLFWATSEAIVGADLALGQVVLWNPAAEALFGWSVDEALGMPLERLMTGTMRAKHAEGVRRYRQTGSMPVLVGSRPVDVVAVRRDGSELHVSLSLTAVSAEDVPGSDSSRRFVLALVRDMTAVREAERALVRTNEAMREFVAAASHDLRTPLTSVLGFARTLQDLWQTLSDDDRAACLDAIVRGAMTANRLVEDLLTLSQLHADAVDPQVEPVPVASMVREALRRVVVPGSSSPRPDVRVEVDEDVVVESDPHHVERMLVNLLSNALRYGRPPVRVTALVARSAGMVEIRVWDAGDGVPEAFEARLFTSFSQVDPGRQVGSGLGLSIIRGLAAANGGSAFYERSPEGGVGCCFGVRLPLPPPLVV